MSLTAGARLGPYEIVSLLGSGGMGEVYRARDPRLGRDVAVKVLPTAFSADPDRLRRFEQEARAAAALNHPAILAVHDIGTEAGAPYIVSELLEGETIRDRLNRGFGSGSSAESGGLAIRKAVDYAIQIARGLSAAHEKGIIHRDLKPENLFVTADGRVKILDFGLAKLTEPRVALAAGSLPTAPVETQAGMMLGTMGYMAPEQVRGQAADHRTDIFAFGAILYEMLSGQRAFRGATAADTISAILDKDPPDLPMAERHIAPALARVVDRCLEKSPAARFQSTHDLAFALEGLSSHSESGVVAGPRPVSRLNRREQLAWAFASLLALVVVAGGTVQYLRRPVDDQATLRFSIHSPEGAVFVGGAAGSAAISPDGRRIVFAATRTSGGAQMLWIQSLDSLEARVLPGTEHSGPAGAFWSPDGRFVAFFADGKLKKIDIAGGAAQTLCDVAIGNTGGTWGREGVIVFATVTGGLWRVPASGGRPVAATTLDAGGQETSHRRPVFLPDGRRFMYVAQPGNAISVGSLDSTAVTPLLNADSQTVYSAGYLVFARQGTLFAQPFDAGRGKLSGEAIPVADQIASNSTAAAAGFGASENGVLMYVRGAAGGAIPSQLTWFDRNGKQVGSIGSVADYRGIELSLDEHRLAEHPHEGVGGGDVWLRDLSRETTTRLTFGAHNTSPIWSPDGARVAFGSNRPASGQPPADGYAGTFNLYEKRADGTGDMTVLLDSVAAKLPPGWKQPTSWSPDGQLIVLDLLDPKTTWDIWAVSLNGDRKPRPLLQTEFQELQGQISPDGRWLAYTSNETRRLEVYVRPLSASAGKWQISTGGGSYPRWRRDGKELFYLSRDRKLMAVPVNSSGPAIEAGIPHALFDVRLAAVFNSGNGFGGGANSPYPYVVTRDGQRFLVSVDTSQQASEIPLTVVVNWMAGLKK